jgi:hypothetical protein
MTREIIITNTKAFEKDLEKYNKWLEFAYLSLEWLEQETNVSIGIEALTADDAYNTFMQTFGELYKEKNVLGLKPVKLFDLLSLNLEKVISIFNTAKLTKKDKPDIKDYSIYAETEQELERLQTSKEFLAVLKKLHTNVNFTNVYKSPIKFDVYDRNSLIPNHHWIKGQF